MRISLLVVLLFVACACSGSGVDSGEYAAAVVLLPEGDPSAGREAFVTLGCATCHTVAHDPELPAPVDATPAPELGLDDVGLGPGRLATSIIAPSHRVADAYRRGPSDRGSAMGDFTNAMTIRQLADIVVYLERQALRNRVDTGVAPG